MRPLVRIVPNALTIDLDAKDINGNEYVTVEATCKLLERNYGYIDGDSHQIVIYGKKGKYGNKN